MSKTASDALERHYRARRTRKIVIGRCVLAEMSERRRSDWKPSLELMRLREIEAIIFHRHGSILPETDDADLYIEAAAFAQSDQNMIDWCRKWAPWAGEEIVGPIVEQAKKRSRMMRADGVAGLLRVTMKERDDLDLKTIGACDMAKGDRLALAKERKRARDRKRMQKKRSGKSRKDRQTYEAESAETLKPWEAEGISRRTWYRRRGTSVSRVDIYTIGDIPVPTAEKYAPPVPSASGQNTDGAADRCAGLGDHPPAGRQGAEPHGSGDNEAAA
ncbi:hypothetical protein C7441_112135 [Pseudaminobacter salicylatoxidans]|uniref:Uncharacterized protein n=1 Tax=Pseudaminobacter salicylatoxidans TaxID=93369 RepID=A0A316BZY6_PSESE|nr:hypothetical protein [Pseudaminobacter salicylatoxidans]PWJ80593.1 hypothetical protein C7441_112135 [Pseudaminobacter salicylatoxidans]